MLEIGMSGIVKNYGFKNVLNNMGLEIMTADRVAIVGRNGSGKSTILKIISGEENVQQGTIAIRKGATVGYLEQIPTLTEKTTTARSVLMQPFENLFAIEQRMRTLELEMSVTTDTDTLDRLMRQYAFGQSQFEALDGYAIEENFSRITTGFGIDALLERPFNVLSGGQKTIVMLARTILRQPDILLLDEPTNHLDIKTLEWFENYLAKYKGTVVIVSHDRYFLDKVVSKTIVLDGGVCKVYHGNYSFSQKEAQRELLIEFEQYKNQQKKIEAMKSAIKRYRDWAAQGDNEAFYKKAKELEKRLEKMEVLDKPMLEKQKIPIQFTGDRTGRDVLRLVRFALSIGELSLLRNVHLTVFYQDHLCLLGDNGTGKTTLIREIMNGRDDKSFYITPKAKIGYIPQEIRFVNDKMTVLEAFREEFASTEGIARGILAKYFFFGEHVYKRVSSLSGGEKVLLMLAIMVQKSINFLILDEPTNHIDIETREMLEEALLDYKGTLLFVSHDRYFIQKIANRIVEISNQQLICYEGDYEYYRAMQER